MNLFKNTVFLLATFSIMGLSSCKKEDCSPPPLTENIIGTWRSYLTGSAVQFKTDGTYDDADDALFGVVINGEIYNYRTYVISGNTLLLTVAPSDSVIGSSAEFEVTQNECDEIKLSVEFFGIPFIETLERR